MRRFATAFGVRVGLDVADGIDPRRIEEHLPYWWRDSEPPAEDDDLHMVTITGAEPLPEQIGELELWVAEHAVNLVFVHAAVVAVEGRALVVPGRSWAGKTTLAAELLRRGADYASDEYAVLRPDGRVLAYPRPLALRTDDGGRRVPAADLGAQTLDGPAEVTAIADLTFRAGAVLRPETMSPGAAALRLFDNAVCASSRPDDTLQAVTAAAGGARAITGVRGEASDVAAALLALL